jgi:hypothetical protein
MAVQLPMMLERRRGKRSNLLQAVQLMLLIILGLITFQAARASTKHGKKLRATMKLPLLLMRKV